jgi:hypothetical protein
VVVVAAEAVEAVVAVEAGVVAEEVEVVERAAVRRPYVVPPRPALHLDVKIPRRQRLMDLQATTV